MGSRISTTNNEDESFKKSNVKLQAQHVSGFSGNTLKWHAWKKKTRAAIGTAGMLRILDDENYALRNKVEHKIVFHLLQVATADSTAAQVVDNMKITETVPPRTRDS